MYIYYYIYYILWKRQRFFSQSGDWPKHFCIMKCSDENILTNLAQLGRGNPKGSLWTQLSRWRWNSYGWALCTWWYFSSSRCFYLSEFCKIARLQTHFKYSTIPEMCFFTWGFQLDMLFCNCLHVTFETVSSRCEARPWTSFFVCWTRGATLSRCPWLAWWFSAVNGRCDGTRQYNGPSTGSEHWQLPLRTAIATSNPSDPGLFKTRGCGDGGIYPTRNFSRKSTFSIQWTPFIHIDRFMGQFMANQAARMAGSRYYTEPLDPATWLGGHGLS